MKSLDPSMLAPVDPNEVTDTPPVDPMTGQPAQDMGMGGQMPGQMGGQPPQAPPVPAVIPTNSWDNHQIHIDVHNSFRKTQEFESLPNELKAEFESHVAMHQAQQSFGMPGMGPQGAGGDPNSVAGAPPDMPGNAPPGISNQDLQPTMMGQ
jgi:hypothetical protein